MQKLRTVTNDNEMVTVQVPSAGGGLTNTQIPKTALEDYLYQQGREYDSNQKYIVYDPKIVDKVKQEHPERFADPINNSLNWLMTGGAGLYRAATNGALSTAGKAATDLANRLSLSSTYQTGVGLAATPTTGAVIGDAALATGTMIPTVYSISRDGLNLVNGTETALGLLPVVGPVYRNVSIGAKNTKRAVNEFRLAREINKSSRNTKLINKDIEVVSPVGVTEGAGLNAHSKSDVGFHFSPRGSSTSITIQNQTGAPFVRVGYQTTSENIPYIVVNDKGNWGFKYNPEIYRGVNPGTTLSDNVLALDKIGPNFKYTNLYEGKGNSSYFTTDPSSIQLSKNALAPRYEIPLKTNGLQIAESQYVTNLGKQGNSYIGYIGDKQVFLSPHRNSFAILSDSGIQEFNANTYSEYLQNLRKLHDEYVSGLSPLDKELYLSSNTVTEIPEITAKGSDLDKLVHDRTRQTIDDFYNSDEYIDRYAEQLKLPKPLAERFHKTLIQSLEDIQSKYRVGMFTHPNRVGQADVDFDYKITPRISLSTRVPNYDTGTSVGHEFRHQIYNWNDLFKTPGTDILVRHNNKLVGDASRYLQPSVKERLSNEMLQYYTDPNELHSRVGPVVEEIIENGWTVEEAFNKSKALKDSNLKDLFNKDYIIKLLGGMLTTTPLIASNNE